MLAWRVASAVVGIPLLLGATYVGGWPLAGLVAAASLLGGEELARLLERHGGVSRWPVRLWAAGSAALAAWRPEWLGAGLGAAMLALSAGTVLGAALGSASGGLEAAARRWMGTLAAFFYPSFLLAHLVSLRQAAPGGGPSFGPAWFVLFLIWAGDTAAYFVGRRLGRTRLAPAVSPGKTVAGVAAGLAGGAAVGLWAGPSLAHLPPTAGALIGLLVAAAGIVGDLFESLLKRAAGVKDAGALIPGHGGILDRFDSLAFALPVAYYLLAYRG